MKNLLFAFAVKFIAALVVTNGAYAQTAINFEVPETKDVNNSNKAIIPAKDSKVSLNAVGLRAVKNFKKTYKMVSNENWFEVPEGFNARFTLNGINNLVYYNKKGHREGSLKIYGEDNLDRDVRDIVKREYYDYKITSVDEIEAPISDGIPTYIVHLEDKNNIKLVRVRDREMDVYREFTVNN